jgi:hypothetical protein
MKLKDLLTESINIKLTDDIKANTDALIAYIAKRGQEPTALSADLRKYIEDNREKFKPEYTAIIDMPAF